MTIHSQGSKEVEVYCMIKIGESFIKKISVAENFEKPGERVL